MRGGLNQSGLLGSHTRALSVRERDRLFEIRRVRRCGPLGTQARAELFSLSARRSGCSSPLLYGAMLANAPTMLTMD